MALVWVEWDDSFGDGRKIFVIDCEDDCCC